MTEKEIIEYLKDNKTKGIAFGFMPEEVRNWISKNYKNPKLLYFTQKAEWKSFDEINDDYYNVMVLALPNDYKVKQEPKGGWVEFEIDKNGQFTIEFCEDALVYCYDWFNWWKLLEKSKEYDYGFTAFGGWQYKNCKAWFMQTMLFQEDHYVTNEFEKEPYKTEPAIPIKIRFWRKR